MFVVGGTFELKEYHGIMGNEYLREVNYRKLAQLAATIESKDLVNTFRER